MMYCDFREVGKVEHIFSIFSVKNSTNLSSECESMNRRLALQGNGRSEPDTKGYPSKSSETGGLQRDQFVKHSKSHAKWYGLHPNQDRPARSVSLWHCGPAKVNRAYSRIGRSSRHTLSQDTLQKLGEGWNRVHLHLQQAAGLP